MSELEFLSPGHARPHPEAEVSPRSPLARALSTGDGSRVEDISLSYGKLEVRGDVGALDVDAHVVRITPQRALVLCAYDRTLSLRRQLREQFLCVDMTGALAGVRLRGASLLRRLTDLDLDRLPAAGSLAGVPAVVVRRGDEFDAFFRQEYADHVGGAALDAARGLKLP